MVDILDNDGSVVGQKPRREVDKTKDIYHTVFVLVLTPQKEVVLGVIPPREDLPNLFPNMYGGTMATIRRSGETALEAAKRGIARELFIDDADPQLIGEGMENIEGRLPVFASLFVLYSDPPVSFSLIDIASLKPMSQLKFEALLEVRPERVTPTLQLLWAKYGKKITI